MAQFTVTAFKWTGTYYNATYTDSHSATFEDNDGAYEGDADKSETVSIDGGHADATWGSPYAIDVSFTDAHGEDHVETFYFFNTDGDWYFVPSEDSAFSEGATLGSYQSHTVGWEYDSAVCFADGTLIATESGLLPVETLEPGCMVQTLSGASAPLRLNLSRHLPARELRANSRLRPVCIEAGALGAGLPLERLWVSRQHRMLVSSPICRRMFDTDSALIAAIRLTALPGCFIDHHCKELTYHHLVFDDHAVVFANGAPAESFFPGPEALRLLAPDARKEFLTLFPEVAGSLSPLRSEHCIPKLKQQKRLIARHKRNAKPLLPESFATAPPQPSIC